MLCRRDRGQPISPAAWSDENGQSASRSREDSRSLFRPGFETNCLIRSANCNAGDAAPRAAALPILLRHRRGQRPDGRMVLQRRHSGNLSRSRPRLGRRVDSGGIVGATVTAHRSGRIVKIAFYGNADRGDGTPLQSYCARRSPPARSGSATELLMEALSQNQPAPLLVAAQFSPAVIGRRRWRHASSMSIGWISGSAGLLDLPVHRHHQRSATTGAGSEPVFRREPGCCMLLRGW